jgi:hypothetical protein
MSLDLTTLKVGDWVQLDDFPPRQVTAVGRTIFLWWHPEGREIQGEPHLPWVKVEPLPIRLRQLADAMAGYRCADVMREAADALEGKGAS